MYNPLQILDRYKSRDTQTDTPDKPLTQEQSTVSDSNGHLSSSQKFAYALLDRVGGKPVIGLLSRFRPQWGISSILDDIDDKYKIHELLYGINAMLTQVLQEDHEEHGIEGCSCFSVEPTDTTETREESTTSILGRDDGLREEYVDASIDGQLPESVQPTEVTSSDSDSGYEAQVHGREGVEWPDNLGDWKV